LNLLEDYLFFDNLFVIAKDLQESAYEKLQSYYASLKEIPQRVKNKEILKILNTQTSFTNNVDMDVDDLDSEKRNLVVFDDCITEKNQDPIRDLFIRGRKKNASIIYITQSFYKVPKIIRDNSNYFIFFKLHFKDLKRIIKEIDNFDIPQVTLDNYDFFMLDRKNRDPSMRLRKNFLPING
jgi:hypothetical protein